MSLDAPKTEDDIYNEVRSQLAKILMTQEHTIYNLERQSKEVSEYPIHTLARQAGFRNTREMLEDWFGDLVDTEGETIRAYSSLYDTPELQHIISLQERTKMKTRKGGFTRRGRGGGGRGGGRAGQATNRPIPLRAPPTVGRRDPPPPMRRQYSPPRRQQSPPRRQQSPPRRQISPPRGFTTGGFTVRPSIRQPAQLAAATSPRRQPSPGGESVASSRREQPLSLNRITSPYGHDRRLSPPGSVHNYSSASTEIAQPDYLDEYGSQARGRRGYNDTPDYVDRTERTVPGPPPGFVDDRQHVEVRARRYESVASPDITSTRTYDYNLDDDADPFSTNTAVLLHNDEYVNVPTYETVHHRQEERLPTRQEQFYDDEFEREYYIPARETATPYVSTRQAYDDRQPSPRHVYDDRQLPRRHAYDARQPLPHRGYDDRRPSPRPAHEPVHNYQNGYRGRQEPSPPPVPQNGYDRYGHHRVDGRSRERNTPDAEIFHDAADNFNYSGTKHDSLPTIDLPPCRTFAESEKPIRQTLLCNNEYASISALLSHPFIPEESSKPPYSTNRFEYFCQVMADIHLYCSEQISDGRPPPVLNNILRELLQKVNFEPGYDAWSIYYVMKELGPAFFDFREDKTYEPGFAVLRVIDTCVIQNDAEYKRNIKQVLRHLMPELNIPELVAETSVKAVIFQSKDENFPYFVKLHKTLKDEKDLENLLRTAPTLDMINPYPGALCIYRRNTVPYRAQIIAEISTNKISIELVDVGVFLTVPISDLKRVESIDLSLKPRYAIPVQLVNYGAKKLVFVEADDGFPRKSTNKTVSMMLTPRNKYMSMTLY
jgi:hypothetical protein